jgi:hypothetical protein
VLQGLNPWLWCVWLEFEVSIRWKTRQESGILGLGLYE